MSNILKLKVFGYILCMHVGITGITDIKIMVNYKPNIGPALLFILYKVVGAINAYC